MARFAVFFLAMAAICLITEAQLTFSSGWGQGKRSVNNDMGSDACSTDEAVYAIYKLIESVAEKLVVCQGEVKN
ncbi:hypothetical protein O3G_MSEX007084 [Manduca sexta]|uniref:Adipokinetic hormone 1 n=1 Tax=Manduca sexta TaxID=7130 RepID=A0A921Z5E1_MANSE|nr:hypothetical protein O3G_MSEX007084 [Manduca sexta]KAG6451320.1 hypothetical protein O3G_MSEX007084 [Manduca sexta]